MIFEPPEILGATAPYLKSVAGVPGDRIAVDANRGVWIGDRFIGRAKPVAQNGRALEAVASGPVPDGHFFVFADHPDSHDSRYAEIGLGAARSHPRPRRCPCQTCPGSGFKGPWRARTANRRQATP